MSPQCSRGVPYWRRTPYQPEFYHVTELGRPISYNDIWTLLELSVNWFERSILFWVVFLLHHKGNLPFINEFTFICLWFWHYIASFATWDHLLNVEVEFQKSACSAACLFLRCPSFTLMFFEVETNIFCGPIGALNFVQSTGKLLCSAWHAKMVFFETLLLKN